MSYVLIPAYTVVLITNLQIIISAVVRFLFNDQRTWMPRWVYSINIIALILGFFSFMIKTSHFIDFNYIPVFGII